MKWFVDELKKIAANAYKVLTYGQKMILLSTEKQEYMNAKICHICDENIDDDQVKVMDHSHLTGKFRGAAHQQCNLSYQEPRIIPVVFHNLSKNWHKT